MRLYIRLGLKKLIFVHFGLRSGLGSKNPFTGQNIFVFKVAFVGTLNLCFKMADTEKKTKTQSDQYELRKRPKWTKITF